MDKQHSESGPAADSPQDTRTLSPATQISSISLTRSKPALPARIGHYRFIRLLGQGGTGAVYEAEQDQPKRTVALKVIKGASASPELLRRFEQEWEALFWIGAGLMLKSKVATTA